MSVLAWGLVYLILGVVPAGLFMRAMFADWLGVMHQVWQPGAFRDPTAMQAAMAPMQARMMLFQPLMLLGSLAARAVLSGAVFRAVLEPENRGFAYLRLGGRELWLGLLNLVAGILAGFLIFAVVLAAAIVAVVLAVGLRAAQVQGPWIGLAEAPVVIAAVLVILWVCARFALAGPMTFAEREFRLFESWNLTKGIGWKLLGLAVLLSLVVLAFVAVFDGLLFGGALAAAGASGFHAEGLRSFFAQPPQTIVQTIGPWVAGAAVIGSFLTGAMFAISLAPWAEAYRKVAGEPAAAPPPGPAFQDPASPPAPDDHGHGGHDEADGHDHGHRGH